MEKTRQQISRASAPAQEQVQGLAQNNQLSTIEEEEHTQCLTHVEQDVNAARANVERIEATLVHLVLAFWVSI